MFSLSHTTTAKTSPSPVPVMTNLRLNQPKMFSLCKTSSIKPFSSIHHVQFLSSCTSLSGLTNILSLSRRFVKPIMCNSSSSSSISSSNWKLKIAIIGFGNFGQFLAKTLISQGHIILAYSRSDYAKVASHLGVMFFKDPNDLCEEHPDVVLLCTSILSTERMLKSLPLQRLKQSTLFVDVLSVKEYPRKLFLDILPKEFDILCSHPMFGPVSGKDGWDDLPYVYDKVRINGLEGNIRCEKFIDIFRTAGCRVIEMSCFEHDKSAAKSQFVTHFIVRVLERVGMDSTPINTKGYESLRNLVNYTINDSYDLFFGLFLFNENSKEQLEKLDMAYEEVKELLYTKEGELKPPSDS